MWSIPSFNTLLSLPLLTVFLLPGSATSYTTSLNLFFFYLTWSTLVLSYRPLAIELSTILATRAIFFLLPCALCLAFDASVPSVAKSLKQHGQRALPVSAAGISRQQIPRRVATIAGVATFNVLLGACLQITIELFFTEVLNVRSALRVKTTLPMPWSLAKDITRAYIIRGVVSYYIHRNLLHSAKRSPTLTRWHGTWAHSLRTTMPFGSAYDHPAVYLLHRWLPAYLPALLFREHILTYLLFTALISLEEFLGNSGYSVLPSTIMLAGIARRQEAHLMSGGAGNFAPFGLLDWLHGTTVAGEGDVMDDVQDEARKHDVKGKSKKAVKGVEDMLDDDDDDDDQEDEGTGTGEKESGKLDGEKESIKGNGSAPGRLRRGKK